MMYLGDKAVGIATLKELDGFFEVVHRFTPTENENRHTMPNFGCGMYLVCEDPILTFEKSAQSSDYQNYSLIMSEFVVYGSNQLVRTGLSIVTTSSTTTKFDYWGAYAVKNDDNTITIGTASSNANVGPYLAGHNYIVLKTLSGGDT